MNNFENQWELASEHMGCFCSDALWDLLYRAIQFAFAQMACCSRYPFCYALWHCLDVLWMAFTVVDHSPAMTLVCNLAEWWPLIRFVCNRCNTGFLILTHGRQSLSWQCKFVHTTAFLIACDTFAIPACFFRHECWNRLQGCRVGEAANPGHSHADVSIALVNPTSLTSKDAIFEQLITDNELGILACAETSATRTVQAMFSKFVGRFHMKSLWSPPVEPHKFKINDEASLRGKAMGVSLHSRFPCRQPWRAPLNDWTMQVRVLRTVVQLGVTWVQVIVIYGYSTGHPGWRALTNNLFQYACNLSKQLALPTIYLGDYNLDVHTLQGYEALAEQGYVSLQQLHRQRYGKDMEHTCRGATSPDTAIVHPLIAQWISSIQVLDQGFFDTHCPVIFRLQLPSTLVTIPKIRYPESWLQFGIAKDDLQEVLDHHPELSTAPNDLSDLAAWGKNMEAIVHEALLVEHHKNPHFQLPPGLPRRCKGRCRPAKRVRCPLIPLARNSRRGNFEPDSEPVTFQSRRLLKQLRRIESLKHKVRKLVTYDDVWPKTLAQLQQEWDAICKQRIQGQDFYSWVQAIPELGCCPRWTPDAEWLHLLQQFVRIALDKKLYDELQFRNNLQIFQHRTDVTDGSAKAAFAKVRGPGNPCFRQTLINLEELAIPVSEGAGVFTLYLDHAYKFVSTDPLFVQFIPGQLLSAEQCYIRVQMPLDF